MVNRTVAAALDDFTQTQKERLFYIEVKAYFCGDLTRADIERRFGVKPAASARDLSTYRRLPPQNLFYDASRRKYAATNRFVPLFEHSAERVLTWFRAGFGDNIEQKLKRTVPCESAHELVKPDLETLATLTRAIVGRRQVKVNYLSLTSGPSIKTLCPLALADTGLRWHLRAYDLLPVNSATKNLVKSVLWLENGYEETIYRRANHRLSQGSRFWSKRQRTMP